MTASKYWPLNDFHLYNSDVKYIKKVLSEHFNLEVDYGNYRPRVIRCGNYGLNRDVKPIFKFIRKENYFIYHFILLNADGEGYKYISVSNLIDNYKDLFEEDYLNGLIKRHAFLLKDYEQEALKFIQKYQMIYKLKFNVEISYKFTKIDTDSGFEKYYHVFVKEPYGKNDYFYEHNVNMGLSLEGFNRMKALILKFDKNFELHKPHGRGRSNRMKLSLQE